jgi:hypothetical protein
MGIGGRRHSPAVLHPGKETIVQEPGGVQGRSVRVRKIFHRGTVQLVASRYADWANTAHKADIYPEWMSTNGETVYKQIQSKLKTAAWKERSKIQLNGRHWLRRRRSALDCSAIWEEEESRRVSVIVEFLQWQHLCKHSLWAQENSSTSKPETHLTGSCHTPFSVSQSSLLWPHTNICRSNAVATKSAGITRSF